MNIEQQKSEKSPLEIFREEMAEWVKKELEKKEAWKLRGKTGEAYNPHADLIDPALLAESDREIWEKAKSGQISWDDWEKYVNQIKDELLGADKERVQSRKGFRAMVANVINLMLLEKDLKKSREKN